MPSAVSTEPSEPVPPRPPPIRYLDLLPNEIVHQIIEHVCPIEYVDRDTYRARQWNLPRLSRTSRRLRSLARPFRHAVREVQIGSQNHKLLRQQANLSETKMLVPTGNRYGRDEPRFQLDDMLAQASAVIQFAASNLFRPLPCLPSFQIQQIIGYLAPIEFDCSRVKSKAGGNWNEAKVCVMQTLSNTSGGPLPTWDELVGPMPNLAELDARWLHEIPTSSLRHPSLRYLCLTEHTSVSFRDGDSPPLPSLVALKCADIANVDLDVEHWPSAFPSLRILSLESTAGLQVDQHFDRLMQHVDKLERVPGFLLSWRGIPPLIDANSYSWILHELDHLVSSSPSHEVTLPTHVFLPSRVRVTHNYCGCTRDWTLNDYPALKKGLEITWEDDSTLETRFDPRLWADVLCERIERRRAALGRLGPA
ncbi:hypothetical protein JCM10212_000334 [Sporobolomyces blumeae]